jgi:hypothetical protein
MEAAQGERAPSRLIYATSQGLGAIAELGAEPAHLCGLDPQPVPVLGDDRAPELSQLFSRPGGPAHKIPITCARWY